MLESIRKNKQGIILMGISSVCVCVGQLLWKLSISGGFGTLVMGFMFYGMGAVIMIIAYRFGSLSVLQPMLSLNYVFSMFLAYLVLHEAITMFKIIGVLIIMVGVILIAGGDE